MLLLCVPFHSRPSCLLLSKQIKKKTQSNFIIIAKFHFPTSLTIAKLLCKKKSFLDSLARQKLIRHLWAQRNRERALNLPYFDISCNTSLRLALAHSLARFSFSDCDDFTWFLSQSHSMTFFFVFLDSAIEMNRKSKKKLLTTKC